MTDSAEHGTAGAEQRTAVKSRWDALVIGAGPAGAVAACELARRGMQTLLVDRRTFPRPKVCGGCLGARAVQLLQTAKLDVLTAAEAVPLCQFSLRCGRQQLTLALPGGVVVSRATFDHALARAAVEAGAQFLSGVAAAVEPPDVNSNQQFAADAGERRTRLTFADGREQVVAASVVLAADGLCHPSLPRGEFPWRIEPDSRVGMGTTIRTDDSSFPSGAIHMAVGRHGYVGLTRLNDGRLNVAAAFSPAAVKEYGPADCVHRVLAECGSPTPPDIHSVPWHGTAALTRRAVRAAGHRVFLLGDAAGYVEPFTGEGMTWAITDGLAVGSLVERGLHNWNAALEVEWIAMRWRLVAQHQGWCRRLAWLLRHPRLASQCVRLLRNMPSLGQAIVRRIA